MNGETTGHASLNSGRAETSERTWLSAVRIWDRSFASSSSGMSDPIEGCESKRVYESIRTVRATFRPPSVTKAFWNLSCFMYVMEVLTKARKSSISQGDSLSIAIFKSTMTVFSGAKSTSVAILCQPCTLFEGIHLRRVIKRSNILQV